MVDLEFDNIWRQYQAEKERERAAQPEAAASDAARADAGEPGGEAVPAGNAATDTGSAQTAASGAGTALAQASAGGVDIDHAAKTEGANAASPQTGEAQVEAGQSEEVLNADYRKIAERRVRLGLLLAEVGRSNNITVTQDETNQAITREARRHPGYERQVLDFYRQNPEAIANLRAPIFEDKVIDFIVELAKVEERKISPQELLSTPDLEGEATEPAPGIAGAE